MSKFKVYRNLYELYKKQQSKRMIAFYILIALFLSTLIIFATDLPFEVGIVTMMMIFPAIGVGVVALVFKSRSKKSFERFTPEELARIDSQIPMLTFNEGYAVTQDAIINTKKELFLYPVKDILWIYKNVSTVRYYGVIPVSKTSTVMIAGTDHKIYGHPTKNKTDIIEDLHNELIQYRKGIFYGYSPEIEQMFKKNFDSMVAASRRYDAEQQ